MLVRPTMIAPAWRSRRTTVASVFGRCGIGERLDPARVMSPATSNRSFTDTGMPASGEGTMPCARRASLARASASADSRCVRRNTRAPSPEGAAMRVSASSTSAWLVVLRAASSAARVMMGFIGACCSGR